MISAGVQLRKQTLSTPAAKSKSLRRAAQALASVQALKEPAV
jgi:hypothetical protein